MGLDQQWLKMQIGIFRALLSFVGFLGEKDLYDIFGLRQKLVNFRKLSDNSLHLRVCPQYSQRLGVYQYMFLDFVKLPLKEGKCYKRQICEVHVMRNT